MMPRLALLLIAGLASGAAPAFAQNNDTITDIMVPERGSRTQPYEPWIAPRYETPRSDRQSAIVVPPAPRQRPLATVPPPVVSPQTGRPLPNLPGASSAEGFQDRAARCAHQSGVYANEIEGRTGYVGACINQ